MYGVECYNVGVSNLGMLLLLIRTKVKRPLVTSNLSISLTSSTMSRSEFKSVIAIFTLRRGDAMD